MQGVSLFPYPDHLVTIGRGKPSGPIAGSAATYGLGGRISGGLGHEENSRWHKRGGLPWVPFVYGGAQSASPIRLAGRGRRDLDEAVAGTQQDQRG